MLVGIHIFMSVTLSRILCLSILNSYCFLLLFCSEFDLIKIKILALFVLIFAYVSFHFTLKLFELISLGVFLRAEFYFIKLNIFVYSQVILAHSQELIRTDMFIPRMSYYFIFSVLISFDLTPTCGTISP
jgi:hypothetical protein